ncbi:MAG: hypothetical protein M1546_27525 [Chloroflexi bacterium]|nr:hypothetical protein [Chloroflexota bacterium]
MKQVLRICARICAILAAALVVVGMTLVLSQTGMLNSLGAGGPERGAFEQGQRPNPSEGDAAQDGSDVPADDRNGDRPGARGGFRGGLQRGERPGGGVALFAIDTLIKNLAIISIIVVVGVLVSMVSRAVRGRKRGTPAQQPAAPPDSPQALVGSA